MRSFFSLLFASLFLSTSLWAQSSMPKADVIVDLETKSTIALQEFENVDASKVKESLESLSKDREIIVSTDVPEVVEQTLAWSDKNPTAAKPHFFLFGRLLQDQPLTKIARSLGNWGKKTTESIRNDKIGMMVTLVTTSYDSYIWIHTQTGSVQQKTAMIFMNVLLASTFGLNKDLWPSLAHKVDQKMTSVLEKFPLIPKDVLKNSPTASVAKNFLANLSLSVGIQVARMSLFSLDHFVQSVSTASFWGTSAFLGALMTASGWGWSEHIATIDQDKQPAAKFATRRWMEIRSLALSYTSPSSKILQMDLYGITPLVVLVANGAAGLIFWKAAKPINAWLERNPVTAFINTQTQSFMKRVSEILVRWKEPKSEPFLARCVRALAVPY